ncbi:MAG: adenosylmethionine decarboxylase [Gemmatimonas sp.]|nr:adenosylmethionine decarboxylase [Gemmatimonas sp.]
MNTLGRHLLVELWGCARAIDDPDAVREAVREAVRLAGATLLHLEVHSYSPQGVTGVALLAESHLAVHTWPEQGYVAADIYTCGTTADPNTAVRVLERCFGAKLVDVREIARGARPSRAELP